MADATSPSFLDLLRRAWQNPVRYPQTSPIVINGLPSLPDPSNAPDTTSRSGWQMLKDWKAMVDRQGEPGYASTNPDVSAPLWDPNVPPTGPGNNVQQQPMAVADYDTTNPQTLAAAAKPKGPAAVIQVPQQQARPAQNSSSFPIDPMSLAAMAKNIAPSSTPVQTTPNGGASMGRYSIAPDSWSNGAQTSGPNASGGLAALSAQSSQSAPAPTPSAQPSPSVISDTTTVATPTSYQQSKGVDPVVALYDRMSKMSPGAQPKTEEQMAKQRKEDMYNSIALGLLQVAQDSANNRNGAAGAVGALASGGKTGLLGWRAARDSASNDQDKALQQQFVNNVNLAQLGATVENNAANREANALYRQQLEADRKQQQTNQAAYNQAVIQQRSEQAAAAQQDRADRLEQQKMFQGQMVDRWNQDRQSREDIAETPKVRAGKSVQDIYLELRKQNADNFINPKTDDQLLQEAQRISALDGGGANSTSAAAPGGGTPYRGDSPPVANAQRAPDRNWYIKGQDGSWRLVMQR